VGNAAYDRTQPGSGTLLDGLVVLNLSASVPGAQAAQFLADAGAGVIQVEPPGGSPLRAEPGWPSLARGTRSVVLDLRGEAGHTRLSGLIRRADVLVTSFRPRTRERLGLTAGKLAELNPRLVSAAITGWGPTGPWAHLKGYEGMVMAKLGMFHAKEKITRRPGPAFISVPFASWGAAQTAVHAILTALLERESTGRGQHVEADLVRGALAMDTWTWFAELIGLRWPDAFVPVEAFTPDGEPQAHLVYPLLIAPTKDGHWLQFAQVEPRLFAAFLEELGLTSLLADPKWKGFPILDTQELRTEIWEIMLSRVAERTLEEWNKVFETSKNISAELYRAGTGTLDHPQLRHDGRMATAGNPGAGPVRQPSTLVHMAGQPLRPARPAPRLGEGSEDLLARIASTAPGTTVDSGAEAPRGRLPLDGVTILDLGLMFAGPYGATLLTDLGARVIKIEALTGDTIRNVLAFPEAGGAKVMQGKESIALNLGSEDGRRIAREIAGRCDVVLQSFRAGAVERLGLDAATLREVSPDLIYVNAPGYGTGGPYGGRPAYAPSIGAAGGIALTDAPDAAQKTGSLDDVKKSAVRLNAAAAIPSLQADGAAALAVASTILLALLARRRGRPVAPLTTTMLATVTHLLADRAVDYTGRRPSPCVDEDAYGYCALYRLYPAADGWVFLAAPTAKDWDGLVAVPEFAALGEDERFGSPASREKHDAALAGALGTIFAGRPAAEWEEQLTAAGVGCVVAHEGPPERLLQSDEALAAEYTATAVSPVFEEHLRLAPAIRFSRSATQAKGGCLAGQHTDAILGELGYSPESIADLRERQVIG
jgi:crotonobetainyl-CoA:carnitine CoA-transferase CaiB-like acyl-CoA transferase